ncbi:protein spinster homolog 1-like [Xenopus tropicalis]|uniref:Protein spinster homolog 1-like n=1 Tax=Xenopus tropicalis TaxID=8364 RepID=A0A8J1J3L8_XENTR|nr:protein spinster homolog 1-like [Xenopus tropicalis]
MIFSTACLYIPTESFGFWALLCLQSSLTSVRGSYITAAPLIIADLFENRTRTLIQCIFYILFSIACAVGSIFGPFVTALLGSKWRIALQVDIWFDLVMILVFILLITKPGVGGLVINPTIEKKKRSLKLDILDMIVNRSLICSVVGFGAASFATKGAFVWIQILMKRVYNEQERYYILGRNIEYSTLYELGKCVSVVLGIVLGTVISSIRRKANRRADPILCAIGLLLAIPLMCLSIFLMRMSFFTAQVFLFLSWICLSLNQVPVNEIILTTVLPTRFGWAFSEKSVVESIMADKGVTKLLHWIFERLNRAAPYLSQNSTEIILLIIPFMAFVGAGLFLLTSKYIEEDEKKVKQFMDTPDPVLP